MSRRAFMRTLAAAGVTIPLAHQVLAAAGLAPAAAQETAGAPARRGGGGALRALWWQAATLLNPHLTSGLKDADGARLCYEPLASFDPDGALVPVLAQEIPSVENGAVARDGLSVVWKLKRNVVWQDGQPFTAAYSHVNTTSAAVKGCPSCQTTFRLSFHTTDSPSRATPPFSTLGISCASTGTSAPSGSNDASGS